MKNKYILTAMLLCMVLMAEAQENYFYFNWDVNIPLSSTEYIDNTSGGEERLATGCSLAETEDSLRV